MKIGLDLLSLGSGEELTGIGKYALHLSKALLSLGENHSFIFFASRDFKYLKELEQQGGGVITLPERGLPFFQTHWKNAKLMQKYQLDLLHGPANTTPWFYEGKTILTIHDLAIYRHPEWFPSGQGFSTKYLVPHSIKRAEKIIVPSQATKDDLQELFKVTDERVELIPHGVEGRFFKQLTINNSQFTRPYILFVGTIEPRKNVARLLQAYAELPRDLINKYQLVIAGKKGWKYQSFDQTYESLSSETRKQVRILNYVPENELPGLYQNAALFVYPSLYEGFGLPVLEALASGTPVITSNTTSLPEVIGNSTLSGARLIDPESVSQVRDAIIEALKMELNNVRIFALKERAKLLNWEQSARETLNIYKELFS